MAKTGRVIVRDIATGKDVTAESIKRSRQREKELADIARKAKQPTPIPTPTPTPIVSGKEYVFEFSGPIGKSVGKYASTLTKLFKASHVYVEDGSKLVVVL